MNKKQQLRRNKIILRLEEVKRIYESLRAEFTINNGCFSMPSEYSLKWLGQLLKYTNEFHELLAKRDSIK